MVDKNKVKEFLEYGETMVKLDAIKRSTQNMSVGSATVKDKRCTAIASIIAEIKNDLTDEILEKYYKKEAKNSKKSPASPKSTVTSAAIKRATT